MKSTATIILTLTLALLAACSGGIENTVDRAENDFINKRYEASQTICHNLAGSEEFDALSVNDLCRLSTLLVRLAEHSDEESNMALAAHCMQSAIDRSPDSVLIYLRSQPVDRLSETILLQQLSRAADAYGDSVICDMPDSSAWCADSICI